MLDRGSRRFDVGGKKETSFGHVCCSTRLDSLCSLSLSHSLRPAPVYKKKYCRRNKSFFTHIPFAEWQSEKGRTLFGKAQNFLLDIYPTKVFRLSIFERRPVRPKNPLVVLQCRFVESSIHINRLVLKMRVWRHHSNGTRIRSDAPEEKERETRMTSLDVYLSPLGTVFEAS